MNGELWISMQKSARVRLLLIGKVGVAMAVAGLAGGCADLPKFRGYEDAPIDATSPVAHDVREADRHPGPFPRFADIPKLPRDVRPAAAWNNAVLATEAEKAELNQATAEIAARPVDTEAFAAEARRATDVPAADIPSAKSAAETAAYAKALREKVKAPPKARH